jgi:hypothetical protein
MIMVSLDSEVRLFHFTLDPFQILSPSLIGALVGLGGLKGARIVKLLKDADSGG